MIKNNLNINFDFSFIDKFKDYNSNQNNFKMNLSNVINSIRKNNDDFFNSFSSNKNSNDFDLSVSKSFYNITNNTNNNSNNNLSASPKFNSFCDNIKKQINILDYSIGDIVNNEVNEDIKGDSINKIDSFKNIKPNFE